MFMYLLPSLIIWPMVNAVFNCACIVHFSFFLILLCTSHLVLHQNADLICYFVWGEGEIESQKREREREREIARERVKERAGKHNWQGTLKASSSIMRCLIWQCTGFPVEWAYEYNYLYSPKSFFGLPLYNSYLD